MPKVYFSQVTSDGIEGSAQLIIEVEISNELHKAITQPGDRHDPEDAVGEAHEEVERLASERLSAYYDALGALQREWGVWSFEDYRDSDVLFELPDWTKDDD